ncbi:MAG: FtsH protease regulator HflK [Pedosphaera sp.]|nr:FtsH protease regulator HflK [Pedosphaera sp.]
MERNTQRNGLINLLALLAIGAAGYAVAVNGNSLAGVTSIAFLALGALVAAVSWFQMRLEERERLEKLDFDELTKSASSSALFTTGETEILPAQRSREQFERFFVPAFTVLLFLLQTGGALLVWRSLDKVLPAPPQQKVVALGLFAMFGLLLFILGKFSTSLTRLKNLRLLRPGATYLLLGGYLCAAVALSTVLVLAGFPLADIYFARILSGLLLLIGLETLISLVLELYRPRVKGKVERPLYESRLVSLLGQPEGLITTAAQTLDYQFGFKVSETWAYRLFEKWVPWLIIAQLAILLLSTCVVFIDAGQQAVLEHFGGPVEKGTVLGPGAHFKLPWPIEQVYRFPTEQIQSINVGFVPDESPTAGNTVLWTVSHTKEENFLVANRELPVVDKTTNGASAVNRAPPVSLLTVSIPVQFQITNLVDWLYNNEEPKELLSHIATREVVRYFVSVDLHEIMSSGRAGAANELRQRIQSEVNRHQLGATIVFVGLQDIHPPVKVAPDYEKVVAAIHTKEAAILAAEADAIRTNAMAEAQAFKTVSEAESDRNRRVVDSMARAALFTNQLPAYLASPSVYMQRAYLQTFSHSVVNARKYILLATNTQDVIILNLEDKIRPDLLEDLTVSPKTPPKP